MFAYQTLLKTYADAAPYSILFQLCDSGDFDDCDT